MVRLRSICSRASCAIIILLLLLRGRQGRRLVGLAPRPSSDVAFLSRPPVVGPTAFERDHHAVLAGVSLPAGRAFMCVWQGQLQLPRER